MFLVFGLSLLVLAIVAFVAKGRGALRLVPAPFKSRWLPITVVVVLGIFGALLLTQSAFLSSPPLPKDVVADDTTRIAPERPVPVPSPPPAPAPPTPPLAFDPAQYIRQQVAELVPGRIEFNPPTNMRVGVKEPITVRISRSETEDAIKQNLQGRGVPQVENIRVGTFMRVRLAGDGFTVTTRSDENQAVPDRQFAEWLFDVLPVSAGNKVLNLQVSVRFKLPNSEEVTELPVLARNIAVEVNTWWNVEQSIAQNLKWLLGGVATVVASIIGYFAKRWFEKPKPPDQSD